MAIAAHAEDGNAARTQRARQFLARMTDSPPAVSLRNVESIVDVRVEGSFRVQSTSKSASEKARAFLEDGGVARELGFTGTCRVRSVLDGEPTVVRFDFYDGDARIDGAEAIVHVSGDQITYIGGTYPVRSPEAARAGAGSLISTEQARSIALDRLYAHGWTPENKWVRRYKDRIGDPNPFDPLKDIKVAFLIPEKGPSLVYEVNTTCAGYLFWVDAHSGEIVHEELPFVPDVVVP